MHNGEFYKLVDALAGYEVMTQIAGNMSFNRKAKSVELVTKIYVNSDPEVWYIVTHGNEKKDFLRLVDALTYYSEL
jgi:hypothetical protein